MTLGPYASFIIWSYAGVFLVVAILIVWVLLDHRRQKARLRELEQAGVTRRSRQPSAEAS
jgi:heme exporter protein D